MNTEAKRIHNHIIERLKDAVIDQDPYEHLVVKDFLPQDEYERSLDHDNYDRNNLAEAMAPLRGYFYDVFERHKSPEVHSINLQLTAWNQGYSYRPHLDGGPRVFSVLIYQPEHDRHPWLGTTLHKQVGDDFRVVKYIPYAPNTACAFPCGFDHWHGNELQVERHDRRAILCNYFDRKLDSEQHGWDMVGYREYE